MLLVVEAQAGTLDDIGFTDLKLELGSTLPDGSSIALTQVEAPASGACAPDMTIAEFSTITFNDNTQSVCSGISNHASAVAKRFYGSVSSSAMAISNVDLFEAINWLDTGFLNTGATQGPNPKTIEASIGTSTARIANHSWAGDFTASGWASEILRRIDYLVEVDEFVQVVGVHSNIVVNEMPSNSFNAIVAGLSVGTGTTGTEALDATYVSGRAKPDIVAPEVVGSYAAPRVASAAALLMDHAHNNPLLSNSSAIISGNTVYNAELSETVKALLMAGADRATVGNTNAVDITDYRVAVANQTMNGLDKRFGAGQVNIYNSYHLLAAGEQDSAEDGGVSIGNTGFDYDPSFGGLNSSNATASYNFTTSAIGGQKIKASLVWNLDVLTTSTDNFYNLDLQLIDVDAGSTVSTSSTSSIDNTENIWFDLSVNTNYQLKVIKGSGQADFDWDYALAWQIEVPGITVVESIGSTSTAEDGTTDTFTIVLNSMPAGDVTIDLVSSDISEGTVSPSSIIFTQANWSALRTVTVTGVNDALDDGNKNYNIDFTVSSGVDSNYDAMAVTSVIASNIDDDATFGFTDQTGVALNTLTTSDTVVISGLLTTATILITGGEYQINGGAYTSVAGTVNNGNSVTVRTTSSVSGLTPVNAILTIGDISDTFTITTEVDTDGDGVGDSTDAFPLDPTETIDTDSDGVGDNADAFPNDPAETTDSDSDGVGDNVDAFPNNIAASVDTDNDGLPDTWNVGCNVTCQNASGLTLDTSLNDTDNDGVINSLDAFPLDPTETIDTDSDGVGDNADAFPNDPAETTDSDSDGVGDNADAFPTNIAASVDTDNDGLPDAWNPSCDLTCQNASGLTLDTTVAVSTAGGGGGGGSMNPWLIYLMLIMLSLRQHWLQTAFRKH